MFSPQDTHMWINTVSKETWAIGTVSLRTANLTCQKNISTAVRQLDLRQSDDHMHIFEMNLRQYEVNKGYGQLPKLIQKVPFIL